MFWFPRNEQRDFLCDTKTECNKVWREIKVNNYYNAYSFVSPFFFVVVLE